jgi:hypothetical protein
MRYTLLLAILLSACATGNEWTNPSKSMAGFDQDAAECELQASVATAGIRSTAQAGFEKVDIRHKCMLARGYIWGPPAR